MKINHSNFADDIIIFFFTAKNSLQLIIKALNTYEFVSDQLINKDKIHFMVTKNTPQFIIELVA